jgi:twitching motility protein PilJ
MKGTSGAAREDKQLSFEWARLTQQLQPNNFRLPFVKSLGIRAKVIALATIFGVLPVLVVGGVAYRFADDAITHQISREKIAEAEQLANKLSLFLRDRLTNIKTIARFVTILTKDEESIGFKAERRQALIKEKLADEFTQLLDDYVFFSNIALYDLQGKLIVQSRDSAQQVNRKNFPYLQQVLQKQFAIISEPTAINSGSSTQLVLYVVAPVKDSAGKTIAVVAAKMPANFIGDAIFKTIALQQGTSYYMIDSSKQIFQNLGKTGQTSPLNAKMPDLIPHFPEAIAAQQSQTWIKNTSKDKQLYANALTTNVGLNWSVVTATDTAIAFAAQKQLLQTISLGTLLTAVVAAVLAAILAQRAIRPLLQATAAVEKLSQGELDTRIETQGDDELAVLGANINRMAERTQNLLEQQSQNTELLIHQNNMLTNLARCDRLIEGNAKAAARAFTQGTAETLTVARVSIWLYNSKRDRVVCLNLYESNFQQHSEGTELKAVDFPAYFEALELDRPIVADDAHTNPATWEFSASYLMPLGINSMLNVPIRSAGRIAGVICCEHIGETRQWQAGEISFVSSVANLMSLALEGDILQQEVGHLLQVVSTVEDGDLTTRADVSDRTTGLVADTFNRLLEQLGEVLSQVLSTAQSVSAGSTALGKLAQTVATNAQEQAQEVTQVQKLTEQVEQSAQSSTLAIDLANKSLLDVRSVVEQGQDAIDTMTQGIDVLQGGTNRIVQQMKALGEFVGLADQFVQDQSQIASLTQVLALNATLVAARASEQRDPRQFLVVAREFEAIASQVSNLAQQTNDGLVSLQQRTDQIHTVVSAVDAEIQNLGGLVSGFTTNVAQSNRVFGDVRMTTGQVVQAGEAVAQSNQEILNAAQSTASAIQEIAELANRTALLTRKAQRRSEGMENLSLRLLSSIQFFRLPVPLLNNLPTEPSSTDARSEARAEVIQL